MTAMSVMGSRPTIVALELLPSWKVTVSLPPLATSATTWLFVRMCPSVSRRMPDPSPALEPLDSRIETTLGSTSDATAATVPAGRVWSTDAFAVELEGLLLALNEDVPGSSLPGRVAMTTALAPVAPMIPARSATATTEAPARRPRLAEGVAVAVSCGGSDVPLAGNHGSEVGTPAGASVAHALPE